MLLNCAYWHMNAKFRRMLAPRFTTTKFLGLHSRTQLAACECLLASRSSSLDRMALELVTPVETGEGADVLCRFNTKS